MAKRGRKKTNIAVSAKTYPGLVKESILDPFFYSKVISKQSNLKAGLGFFLTNLTIFLVLNIIIDILLSKRASLIFPAISEALPQLPFIVIGLFLYTVVLFLIAKLLGGKASLKKSLVAVCFASNPLLLAWLPDFGIISAIYFSFLLVLIFYKINEYSWEKAVINIFLPFLMIIITLIMLGLLNFSLG